MGSWDSRIDRQVTKNSQKGFSWFTSLYFQRFCKGLWMKPFFSSFQLTSSWKITEYRICLNSHQTRAQRAQMFDHTIAQLLFAQRNMVLTSKNLKKYIWNSRPRINFRSDTRTLTIERRTHYIIDSNLTKWLRVFWGRALRAKTFSFLSTNHPDTKSMFSRSYRVVSNVFYFFYSIHQSESMHTDFEGSVASLKCIFRISFWGLRTGSFFEWNYKVPAPRCVLLV